MSKRCWYGDRFEHSFSSSKYHQGAVALLVRHFILRDKRRSDSLRAPDETANLF